MDNAIAAGRAVPMIVVMECNYAYEPGESLPPPRMGRTRSRPPRISHTIARLIVDDLIPMGDGRRHSVAAGIGPQLEGMPQLGHVMRYVGHTGAKAPHPGAQPKLIGAAPSIAASGKQARRISRR